MSGKRAMDAVYGLVWTDSVMHETVPATFAIGSRWPGDPWWAWRPRGWAELPSWSA